MKTDNFSMSEIQVTQLLPSGKYRANVNITDAQRKTLLITQYFFSVSDNRVERFW